MTNSIQKTPFCKSTVSKKSTGIIHKAKLHCTRPYHPRPYYNDFKAMLWRFRCETHKLLASLNKSDGCSLVQEGWLTWVQGKKQQSIKTKPTWMQAHFSLFKTDTLQSHLHSLDAMVALHVALQGVLKHSSCRFTWYMFRECIMICTHCIGPMCELFVTCLLLAGTRLAMHTYYKHSATTNSIQKTPFCKSTVSKKSTGIVHKAKLHCIRPYHTRPYYNDFKAMPWRFQLKPTSCWHH